MDAIMLPPPLSRQAEADGRFDGSLDRFILEWTAGNVPYGSWSAHVASWLGGERGAPLDPRVLVVSYEDLKADLRACVRRVNAHCGFGRSDARLDELLPRFEFEWMRANEERFNPRSVGWVRPPHLPPPAEGEAAFHFIRAGRVGDGTAPFGQPEQRAALRAMLAKTFPHGVPEHVARLLPRDDEAS